MADKAKCRAESSRDCVSEEVSGVLSVPNKPSGFCGRKAVFTYLQVSSVLRVCVRARECLWVCFSCIVQRHVHVLFVSSFPRLVQFVGLCSEPSQLPGMYQGWPTAMKVD